jgi:prepilin-type N-terminal cleavage/methylation domain-containing protein
MRENIPSMLLRSARKGFTLIELLIVVGIIAVLVAVLAVALLPWIQKAKPKATKALLKNLGDAVAGERVSYNEIQFKKDAGVLASSASSDKYKKSSQILMFYLCPSKDEWEKAPMYKSGSYNPKLPPEQFKDSTDSKSEKLPFFVDAWDRSVWYSIDKSGRFYIRSAGDDGNWDTDDDLIFDSANSSVKEYSEIK